MEMSIKNVKTMGKQMAEENDLTPYKFHSKTIGLWIKEWDDISIDSALSVLSKENMVNWCHGLLVGIMSVFLMLGFQFQDAWKHIVLLFPDNFRLENIPNHWLFREARVKKERPSFDKVVSFQHLYNQIKEKNDVQAKRVRNDLLLSYLWEVGRLICYSENVKNPMVAMFEFTVPHRQDGQYISEFWVKDMDKPHRPCSMNFHGQNTSQWVYAGCICVQGDDVTTHH